MITNVFVKQDNMKTFYCMVFRKILDNTDDIANSGLYFCMPARFKSS